MLRNNPVIELFKRNTALVLVAVVFLTFCPTLFNGFVGDDHLLVESNVFYASWKNVPRLFTQGYAHQDRDFFSNTQDYGTGSVAYRPVLSLTYFLDRHVWGNNPFGFHLTNLLIHCLNCFLFYLIISCIWGPTLQSLLAAFLFGLHPIQSEAVAVIGYRADLLSAFFVFLSFFFWIRFQSQECRDARYYFLSLGAYFLAVFSKESAILLPALIFCYERMLSDLPKRPGVMVRYYLGFIPVTFFYLYVYLFIFPNSSLALKFLGGSLGDHVLAIFQIGYTYLMNFIAPWTIRLLPGEYCPPIPSLFSVETAKIIFVFLAFVVTLFKLWQSERRGVFLLMWFLVFYIPVSNLIPIANPMAYRFMYLPSAGLSALYAMILYQLISSRFITKHSPYLLSLLYVTVILVCITCTLYINSCLKSDFDMGYAMVNEYPESSTGYVLMGEEYYKRGAFDQARDYFENAVRYGYDNPQIDMQLGVCYFYLGDLEGSKRHLLSVVAVNPDYAAPYLTLGNIYYLQQDYEHERQVLEKARELLPDEPVNYINLMKLYVRLHDEKNALKVFQEAQLYLPSQQVSKIAAIYHPHH